MYDLQLLKCVYFNIQMRLVPAKVASEPVL